MMQDVIDALIEQRNSALNEVVMLKGQLADAKRKVAELEKTQVADPESTK